MFGIIFFGNFEKNLWPLSTDLCSENLLTISENKTIFQSIFELLIQKIPQGNIITVANRNILQKLQEQLKQLSSYPKILSEPIAKNTAPSIVTATKYIAQTFSPEEIILAIPSDIIIKDVETFKSAVNKAETLAQNGYIVTFGINPSNNITYFAQIKTSIPINNGFKVETYNEISEIQLPLKANINENYFSNCGILMFKASTLLDEIKKYCPEISKNIDNINFQNSPEIPYIEYEKMPDISIDKALLKQTDKLAMVKLECDFQHIRNWHNVYEFQQKDLRGNYFTGEVIDKGSENCLIYSSSKPIATIGLENTIIIETPNAILACNKNKTDEIKEIYETFQNQKTNSLNNPVYRPWGFYTVIAKGKGFLTKIIHVNPKQKLSLQSHEHRCEHWVVLSGKAKVILDSKDFILAPGQSIDIPLKAIHSLQNPFEDNLEIIEIQKGDILIEEDIIRYEDMYGRCT